MAKAVPRIVDEALRRWDLRYMGLDYLAKMTSNEEVIPALAAAS